MLRTSGPAGDAGDGRRRIHPAAIAAGALCLGFGALYAVGLLVADGEVPAGTQVRGVDIGGLSAADAERKLERELAHDWPRPVQVRVGDRTATVDPRAAGITLDAPETVDRAARSGSDPFTVIGRLFSSGDGDAEAVQRVDDAKLRTALTTVAKTQDRTVREGSITFRDGEAVAVPGRAGEALDLDPAAQALRSAVAAGRTGPVELPVTDTTPKVGAEEVNRAMKEFAEPAMSAPVTLTAGTRSTTIGPETIGGHLTMKPDASGRLTPRLDAKGLAADQDVTEALDEITDEPVEGTLRLDGGQVVLAQDGKPGQKASADGLAKAVLPVLTREGSQRTAVVPTTTVKPELSRETFPSLGIKERMSTFTVNFDPAPYRTKNIGRAVELINGSVVMPKENWSFNKTVGERTKANGFVDGIIIQNDQYTKAAGGGVSAVATTVFNAIFFAGVKPLEYGAHSFYIERYPEGREATVAWGSLDLRFNNDSGNAIYIAASATDSSVTISFYGTKKYDKVTSVQGPRTDVIKPKIRKGPAENCLPQTPLDGFNVAVERVFTSAGSEVKRETFKTRYVPRDEVTCESPITL
ncbi:VanW family protein [Streptomyces sp. NPDC057638]|uniref:VanW family protein n=1 Tax=Streptomyces sp. NPDC057638 TaxID=3346190 RepID=UPI0036C95E11